MVLKGDLQAELSGLVERASGGILVALDFDGTLAPIVGDPAEAMAPRAARAVLVRLVGLAQRVVVVSGRAQADLEGRLGTPGVEARGDFGLLDLTPDERKALDECAGRLARLVRQSPGVRLEVKPKALSIHFRGHERLALPLLAAASRLSEPLGLNATLGRMVVEVRPPRADKSRLVGQLIRESGSGGVFYAGDDDGDRSTFAYLASLTLPSLRLGVVSSEVLPEIFDACQVWVDSPAGVVQALNGLAERLARPGRAGPAAGA